MSVLAGPTEDSVKHILPKQEYVSDMETCEFTYEWTIKKFSQYKSRIIESSKFSSHFSDFRDVWILKINPSKDHVHYDKTVTKYVSVQLRLETTFGSPLFTKYKISIHSNVNVDEYVFDGFSKASSWMDCVSRDTLLESLQNDELKISCTLTISKEQQNNTVVNSTFIAMSQLSEDFKKLLLNEQSADVTIKVGKKSFRVIKGILAARSPVFDAMFAHEQFKENKKSEVVIEDIEENVFHEFLHYIYTDDTKNVNKMPLELLEVAEKYQVDRLKNICEEVICGTINSDNVSSILIFSDKYNVEKLNKKCLEFIKSNLRDVLSQNTFQVYKKNHPEVFVSVLESIAGVN